MMNVILLDDERPALDNLEKLLEKTGKDVRVIAKYLDPKKAIEAAEQLGEIDVAFVDLEMPGLNGLEAAKKLQKLNRDISIVFVTAYSEYAAEAFELNVIDYVLKPVQRERLADTLQRIRERRQSRGLSGARPEPPMLLCFRSLEIQHAGQPPQHIKWRTGKVKELFAYFVYRRGQAIRKDHILEKFWPDCRLDKATAHLQTTIYRIRLIFRELRLHADIRYADDSYRLDLGDHVCDVDLWERSVREIPEITVRNVDDFMKTMELYRGDYLEDLDTAWAEGERERLRSLWIGCLTRVARCLTESNRLDEAIACNKLIQSRNPLMEESYLASMQIYHALGNRGAVKKEYRLFAERLQAELDMRPIGEIASWYESWEKKEFDR